jgi:hypothetical protein
MARMKTIAGISPGTPAGVALTRWSVGLAALLILAGPLSRTLGVAAQTAPDRGSIEFVAQATPASGIQEPVRGFPFYLLSRRYQDIRREAEVAYPAPNMTAFIEKLDVSPEMKAWMKKNQWVQLSGEEFIQKLTPSDIITVPEFYNAYLQRSAGADSLDFPKAKYKPVDKTKDPAKYERQLKEYHDAVERYIEQNPASKDGMDLELVDTDPNARWQALVAKRDPEIQRRAAELAQAKYFVARAETNLQGQGFVNGVAPGTYWLTTLDLHAEVGDVRALWDVPVTVRSGQTASVVLSNANAILPPLGSP